LIRPKKRENLEKADGKQFMRKVVNVSSVARANGNIGQVNYSTAKEGMTDTAR
jgi:3-oxoacyl-[acyl-carrier protein] reductase